MKKIVAIFFLLLYCFNLVGYRIWFYYAELRSDSQLAITLDQEAYNENDLISIKVPLTLPYQTDWKDYERVNGEITFNGKIYKYVKRKIFKGELILLCLPDLQKMHLENSKDEFFKLVNDFQQNKTSKKSEDKKIEVFKFLLATFDHQNTECERSATMQTIRKNFEPYDCQLASSHDAALEKPPEPSKLS